VLWEGHPSALDKSLIARNLENVWAPPSFELPQELAKVSASFERGNFTKAIEQLGKHLEREGAVAADAARAALAKVNEYGPAALGKAEANVGAGRAIVACEILERLARIYKGSELGDRAKARLDELLKDKAIKNEYEGTRLYELASTLFAQQKFKEALPLVTQVAKSKKFAETKVRERAARLLGKVEARI
jgi:tetratricopeptide (TPR) repeat protein